MQIELPKEVRLIINKLTDEGFEAFVVGGCVRDSLLGRVPNDFDITTSATPKEVKAIFKRTVDTGIMHGTVTVMIGKEGYEVTTYRIDGEYEDGRHPNEVTYTSSLIEDLKRRDFTINAMAYNDYAGVVDEFDGIGDIRRKSIRAVGDPYERFSEDALRIMRAVRFSAQLGYSIEEKTRAAATAKAETLTRVSAERIQVELNKLIMSDYPEKIRDLYEMGISKIIMPEFDIIMVENQNNPHHMYTVGEHTIHALMCAAEFDSGLSLRDRKALRLALLFHDMGKTSCKTTDKNGIDHFYGHQAVSRDISRKILKRLKYDNDTIDRVSTLVKYHDIRHSLTESSIRKDIMIIGMELMDLLIAEMRCDINAQSDYQKEEKLQYIDNYEALYWKIKERGDCVSLKMLAVNGGDLINEGMAPGKEIGAVLSKLLDIVIDNPQSNNKEYLLSIARKELQTNDNN